MDTTFWQRYNKDLLDLRFVKAAVQPKSKELAEDKPDQHQDKGP